MVLHFILCKIVSLKVFSKVAVINLVEIILGVKQAAHHFLIRSMLRHYSQARQETRCVIIQGIFQQHLIIYKTLYTLHSCTNLDFYGHL